LDAVPGRAGFNVPAVDSKRTPGHRQGACDEMQPRGTGCAPR